MSIADELTTAIAAHASWKFRLKSAIDSGAIDVPINTIRVDNACVFGKWLASVQPRDRNAHFATVQKLHAAFHTTAAEVATLATSGKVNEAKAMMAIGGKFALASSQLTHAVTEWKNAVTT